MSQSNVALKTRQTDSRWQQNMFREVKKSDSREVVTGSESASCSRFYSLSLWAKTPEFYLNRRPKTLFQKNVFIRKYEVVLGCKQQFNTESG